MPVPESFPDATRSHPITLPDGTPHLGTVFLNRVIDHPQIEIGDYTYYSDFEPPEDTAEFVGRIAPYLFPFSAERLVIGRFCQIAHGVKFITASANHAMDGISSFPFAVFDNATRAGYQPDQRDTIVGNDVWIGYGAIICPGARIGNGAIIGAGAVVRGAVPDYAIVAGNPAAVVRMRFGDAEIAELNRIAWWDWPDAVIAAHVEAIVKADVAALARVALK